MRKLFASTLLVVILCVTAWGQERRSARAPLPRPFTKSCVKKAANVADVYTPDEAKRAFADRTKDVFVFHGLSSLPNGSRISPYFIEMVPVLASPDRGVDSLSREQIAGILTGSITDWSQVGGKPGAIKIYLHGGELQRKSFSKFAETLGLKPGDIAQAHVTYQESYESLAAAAANDPQAFVIGLRDVGIDRFQTLQVDGKSIYENPDGYPLKVPVYLYARPGKEIAVQEVVTAISKP